MGSCGFLRFRLAREGGERDLCRVQKLVRPLLRNGVDENAVGRTSDEVADALVAGKRRHGFAISFVRVVCCNNLGGGVLASIYQHRFVAALPSSTAMLDGDPGLFGLGLEGRDWSRFAQTGF